MKIKNLFVVLTMVFSTSPGFSQTELWQLQPWAPNDQWVIGADSTGEPVWVGLTEIQIPDSLMFIDEGVCYVDTIKLRQGKGFIPLFDNDVSNVYYHVSGLEEPGESEEDLQVNFETHTLNKWNCSEWEFMFYLSKRYVAGYGLLETPNDDTYFDKYVTLYADTSILATKGYADSLFSLGGGGGSGTIKGIGIVNKVPIFASIDSLKTDSIYYNPTTDVLAIGTDTPISVGSGAGLHIADNSFSGIALTNDATGHTASDGTRLYIYADTTYLSNLEAGAVVVGVNNVERGRFDSAGFRVPALASGGTAPTTSGTLKKLVSDGIGRFSFQDNNLGTVTSVGLILGVTGTDLNLSGSPVTGSGSITINVPSASGSARGVLTAADWTLFNNKLGSLNGLTAATQTFAISTASSGFGVISSGSTHTLNLPYEENSTGFRLGYLAVRRDNSVSMGNQAMGGSGASATNCVAIGGTTLRLAGSTGSGGTNNTCIGYAVMPLLTTGYNNMGFGSFAGGSLTTGYNNICFGAISGLTLTTENGNTFIGYEAGRFNTGSSGVFIGNFAGRNETNGNRLYIESSDSSTPLIGGDFSSNRVGVNKSIGSLSSTLHVGGDLTVDTRTGTAATVGGWTSGGVATATTVGTGLALSSGSLALTGQALAVHNLATNGLIARTGSGTVAARTITNGQGVLVTDGDGVAGNPTLFNVVCSHGMLYNTGNAVGNTLDGTDRKVPFTSSYSNNMTVNTSGDYITIPATGTYEITFTGSYGVNATGLNSIYIFLYVNGSDYGYSGQLRSRENTTSAVTNEIFPFNKTVIGDFTNGHNVEMYYKLFSGSATSIDFYNVNITAKRLK